jgi:uncharacterized protein
MEKSAVIIHGACGREEFYGQNFPAMSNSHWIPWLKKQLLIRGFDVQTPDMPEPYLYDYKLWENYFRRYNLNEKTSLIGYSMVAPWTDPFKEKKSNFFDFKILPSVFSLFTTDVVYSTDDDPDILATVDMIQHNLPNAHYHEFHDRGHFFGTNMGPDGYPEILAVVTQEKIKWVK